MQDPTECLETSLDESYKPAAAVKRSDSYRQANANSPRLAKSPAETMLMALHKASNHHHHNNIRGNHFC